MSNSQSTSNSKSASSMAELMAKQSGAFQVLQKGQEIEGTVKKLTPKEILLDIGAKGDALVIEYDKNNLEQLLSMLKVGDTVKATVISTESEEGFPVVSLRRMLGQKTFGELEDAYENDTVITVSVESPTRGGYFAVSENGIRGFLPTSQIISEGDIVRGTLQVKIIEFDRGKKRVIFSQKATQYETNIEELKKLFPKGEKVKGVVSQLLPYGFFVEFEKNGKKAEGFVHISEISHDRVENLSELYKKGDAVEAVILEIDSENKRVSLSVKQLLGDVFKEASEKYKKDMEVKGTVIDVKARGVTLELEKEVKGFISVDSIPAGTEYKKGETVTATVTDIDMRKRVVVLTPVVTKTFVGYR